MADSAVVGVVVIHKQLANKQQAALAGSAQATVLATAGAAVSPPAAMCSSSRAPVSASPAPQCPMARSPGGTGANNGQAYGAGIFMQGNGTIVLGAGSAAGQVTTIDAVIADETGSSGQNHGQGTVVVEGAGTVVLSASLVHPLRRHGRSRWAGQGTPVAELSR